MDSLYFAFNALAPLIMLAFVGYALRWLNIVGASFVDYLNRYIFYVALPVLIIVTIANIERLSLVSYALVAFVVVAIAAITLAAFLVMRVYRGEKHHRPVLVQSIYRGNFMLIGMPLALRLGGVQALAILAVLNALLVPLTNIFSIVTFRLFRKDEKIGIAIFADLMKTTMKNPLMIAIIIGLAAYFSNAEPFFRTHAPFFPETLDLIAASATPMAMIAIGGQFRAKRVKALARPIIIGVVGRLLVVPLMVFTAAFWLRNTIDFSYAWAALVALFASPVALSSVAVTKGLGGDDELAAQIVLWTSACAIVTLFCVVSLLRFAGLL